MNRTTDATALLERCRRGGLVVPDYDGYCFANVPGTVANVLDVDRDVGRALPPAVFDGAETDVSHVVVVLIDGLGWRRFRRDLCDHRFLARLADRGAVTPLTSVAPSSTASAITTVHTGAPPAEHGVFGWDVRLPERDVVVEVFPHEIRGAADASATPPIPSDDVVQSAPIYPELEAAGGVTRVVQPAGTLGTDYADATFHGAAKVPYGDVAEGAVALRERLEADDGRSYSYFYVPDVDASSHDHGTDFAAYHDALAALTRHLSRALYDDLDDATASETLLVVTADHGLVDFEPGPAGCLDLLSIDGLPDALVRRQGGDPVLPWGDYRLLHLAVRDGELDSAREAIEASDARTFTRADVRDLSVFGLRPGSAFDGRCGDIVCTHPDLKLVYPGAEAIVPKIGMHGGPTPREMFVPFAAARLSRLRD